MPQYEIDWDAINGIPIRDVLMHLDYKISPQGSRFRCKKKTRSNIDGSFSVSQNNWYCHHCQCGGGVIQLFLHTLNKPNTPETQKEAAIHLGELFQVGLTVLPDFQCEDESYVLPSLYIRRDVLDLIGVEKNPLLPINFQCSIPTINARQYSSDNEMFENFDMAQKYCAGSVTNFEISKGAAISLLLNRCHQTLFNLEEQLDCDLTLHTDSETQQYLKDRYEENKKVILNLINQLGEIYEKIIPDEEKIELPLYEDYSEVFR